MVQYHIMMSKLIVFFSRAGENYFGGDIRRVDTGNTEIVAEFIHELTGAPLFKLEPTAPYSEVYYEAIEQAKADLRSQARPALKALPTPPTDTLYLGYPNYWGTMPMAVCTFLESVDLTGVTIKPFCTHEGSGAGHSERDIAKLCPGAKVEKALAIQGSAVRGARSAVERWV